MKSVNNQTSVPPHISLWKGSETRWAQRYPSKPHAILQVCEESLQKPLQGVSKVCLYSAVSLHQVVEGSRVYAEDLHLSERRFNPMTLSAGPQHLQAAGS